MYIFVIVHFENKKKLTKNIEIEEEGKEDCIKRKSKILDQVKVENVLTLTFLDTMNS